MKKLNIFCSSLMAAAIMCTSAYATSATIEEGTHYQRLPASIQSNPLAAMTNSKEQITVLEFFSYGCPGCSAVAQPLADWVKTQPSTVTFTKVPVEFFQGWEIYAKAYYTAEILGVLEKIDLPLFAAIHQDKKNLTSKIELQSFFKEHGVSEEDFAKTFDSFAVNRALERGKMLMRTYRVYAVPTLIVDNQFQTDLQKAKGPEGFISVLSELVEQAKMTKLKGN